MKNPQDPVKNWAIRTTFDPTDLDYLVNLHGILYSKEYGWDETFEAYVAKGLAKFIESYNPDKDRLWLAENEGQIIGSIAIEGHSDKEAQLHWFFVQPDHRGQSLGSELMGRALDFCKESGYTNVFLWTTKDLKAAAHIYSLFGFKKTAEKAHKIWGKEMVEQRYDLFL